MDGDVVAKGRHRHRLDKATGIIFTHPDPKTARFEDRLAWAAQAVMAGRPLLDMALTMVVDIYKSIPVSKPARWKTAALAGTIRPTGKPDWDNYGKITDALNKVVWVDDGQIVDGRVRKWYSDRPRIEIRIDKLSTDSL